ncbi:MAG: AbrB/MazE/SpoVT family DNA-binding domain-containing protein [Candidatus Asgardarchaeia archaeon]
MGTTFTSTFRCKCYVTIPKEVLNKAGLKFNDWVEVTIVDNKLILEKVKMVEIKVKLPEEIIRFIERIKEEEGYGTFEEAASNIVYQAIRNYFLKNENKDLGEKWYLKIVEQKM